MIYWRCTVIEKNKETNILNKLYVSTGNILLLYTHTHTHTHTHINTCIINILFGIPGKYFFTINNCRKKKEKIINCLIS